MKFERLYNILLEQSFSSDNIDLDRAYELFRDEYIRATGQSWSKEKFLDRAKNWEFYGDENGFVAIRRQYSGFVKLVGMAGSNRSKIMGFRELASENLPIWGAVDTTIASMLQRSGYILAPKLLLKILLPMVGKEVFGGADLELNKDGSITMEYGDLGKVTKYFIGSKEYYKRLLNDPRVDKVPNIIKDTILKIISK